jgi:hypothetical protein
MERAVPAAAAAAISPGEMEFFGQDHQAVFVIVEIDSFNQVFHEVLLPATTRGSGF